MRKAFYILLFSLLFLMCGCSVPTSISYENNNAEIFENNNAEIFENNAEIFENNNIETLKSWSFQFNKGTNDYSLFFGLLNKNNEEISADIDVDIRIVNEKGEEVYKGTKSVFKNDFDYYTSQAAGEQYLAELRIPAADIISGKSSNGTVFLTVYKNDTVRFDEVNCSALYCLPISDVELIFDIFPLNIDVKRYDGSVESTIQIDDIAYSFEKDYIPQVKITVSGVKIYGRQDSMPSYDIIRYKLYDSEEYMVTSGYIYLNSLDQGDKFKNDSIVIYDIIPGETYRLILSEYNW